MILTRKLCDFFEFFFTIRRTLARDRVLVFKRPKFVYSWAGRAIITPWGWLACQESGPLVGILPVWSGGSLLVSTVYLWYKQLNTIFFTGGLVRYCYFLRLFMISRKSSCIPLHCPEMGQGLWQTFALKSDEGVYSCIVAAWQANALQLASGGLGMCLRPLVTCG